jgi:hypothetical protein
VVRATFATHGHAGLPSEFCLDQQPLMKVPGTKGTYRTEEDSFAEVKAIGSGPASWEVRLKDGRIRIYTAVQYGPDKKTRL